MTAENGTAKQAFWEAIEHVTEQLMHTVDPGHQIHLVANWGAAEISAVIATSAHAVAAAHAAAVGDWQAVPDHAIDMANAAGNFLSGGLLGAVESAVDAAAAVSREMGYEAPTFSELQHEGFHDLGGAFADLLYFPFHQDAIPGAGAGPANHAVNGDGHDASSTDGGAHDASGASGVTQGSSFDASHDVSSLDGGSSFDASHDVSSLDGGSSFDASHDVSSLDGGSSFDGSGADGAGGGYDASGADGGGG
jgi:hypothetical protein